MKERLPTWANIATILGFIVMLILNGPQIIDSFIASWHALGEAGFFERIGQFLRDLIMLLMWSFIVWVLHSLLMLMIHKMWPDYYDEYGHRRKDLTEQTGTSAPEKE